MEEKLVVLEGVVIPGFELRFTASRSGGPGGQHVNKTSSRVTLRWNLTESEALTGAQKALALARLGSRVGRNGVVTLHEDGSRSQRQNRETARERLAALIRKALTVPRVRVSTEPTRSADLQRLANKKAQGRKKRLRQGPAETD